MTRDRLALKALGGRARGTLVGLTALSGGLVVALQPSPPNRREFRHSDHVLESWRTEPEVQRDCRGCHAYGTDAHAPEAVCLQCHVVDEVNRSTFAVDSVTPPATGLEQAPTSTAFDHVDHLELACKQCHLPSTGFDPMLVERGVAVCERCHSGTEPALELLGAETIDSDALDCGLQRALNESPRMQPDSFGSFRHADHLVAPERPQPLVSHLAAGSDRTCATCHSGLFESDATNLDRGQVDLDACASCHRSESAPLTFAVAETSRPSRAVLTFRHSDHLKVFDRTAGAASENAAPHGYDAIDAKSCHACHEARPGETPDLALMPDRWRYKGCIACHDFDSWKTPKHGEWQGCLECHSFGNGESGLEPPSARVWRRRPTAFRAESYRHRGICSGSSRADACLTCHRAPLPSLPSRIEEQPFSHDTHLPPDPDPADCVRCHPSAPAALRSNQIASPWDASAGAELDASAGLTYDPQACAECHEGGRLEPTLPPPAEVSPKTVVEFNHSAHLASKVRSMTCLTCHPSVEDEPAVGTLPEAANCTMCHDHEAQYETTGGLRGTQVTSCAKCHAPLIPAVQASREVRRLKIVGVSDAQHHPCAQSCFECHLPESPALVVPGDHVFATGGRRNGASDIHPPRQDPNCIRCHWSLQRGAMPDDPTSPAVRRTLGSILEGFPGLPTER